MPRQIFCYGVVALGVMLNHTEFITSFLNKPKALFFFFLLKNGEASSSTSCNPGLNQALPSKFTMESSQTHFSDVASDTGLFDLLVLDFNGSLS